MIISDPYMKKFFKPYYNVFRIIKCNNRSNQISKLSDLIELVKNDEHDLTRKFLLDKTFDYNYANIYLKTEQQEMNYLPMRDNKSTGCGNVNTFSFKKKDSNEIMNITYNSIDYNNENCNEANLIVLSNNENDNMQYKINIEKSEFNIIKQNSNNSIYEKYDDFISNSIVPQILINSQLAEISNKKDKDNVSDISNNRRIDNSLEIASLNSCESTELFNIKKSNFNKNKLGIIRYKFIIDAFLINNFN